MAKKRKSTKLKAPTMQARRTLILDTLAAAILTATPKQQLKLTEFLVDAGLRLFGKLNGLDAHNAIVLFPDDPELGLLYALQIHAEKMQIPVDEVCSKLLATLAHPDAARMAN